MSCICGYLHFTRDLRYESFYLSQYILQFTINKNIILYRVFDDEKEVRIYNIFSQRQDYLQLLQGL